MEIKRFEPVDHKIKALIYGPSGVGKTVFAGTAPDVIFASAEGGLLSLADKNPDFVEVHSLKDLVDLLSFLKTQKHKYQTLVIDSITEINEIIKAEIEKRTGRAIQRADWGEVQNKLKAIFRSFRDLPMHVVFIAQENVEKDEDKVVKVVPSLNGKSATEIAYYMDLVGYMMIESDGTRKIITEPHPKLLSKNRGGFIPNTTEPDFNAWLEKVKSVKNGEQKVQTNYSAPDQEKKPLPQPKDKGPMITKEQTGHVFALWKSLVDLDPTLHVEKSDATRKTLLKKMYGVYSTTQLTQVQADDFIDRISVKIGELKKANEAEAKAKTDSEPPEKKAPKTVKELSNQQ